MFQEIEAVREQQLASRSTSLEYIVWRYSWRYFKKGWAFQRTSVPCQRDDVSAVPGRNLPEYYEGNYQDNIKKEPKYRK